MDYSMGERLIPCGYQGLTVGVRGAVELEIYKGDQGSVPGSGSRGPLIIS